MLLQHPQIELHQVPADDGVGIVALQPCVQPFQQLGAADAVFQIEIQRRIAAVGRPQHVDLPLAAAFQRDGVKFAVGGGFDIQRHQPERRAVVRRRLHLAIEQRPIAVALAVEPHRRGDEAFHQVALGRANVGLVERNAAFPQQLFQLDELTVLAAVQPQHRAVMKIRQRQRFQFDLPFFAQQQFRARLLFGGDKRHRGLRRQAQLTRACVGRQPKFDLGAGGRVAPVASEQETLLQCCHNPFVFRRAACATFSEMSVLALI